MSARFVRVDVPQNDQNFSSSPFFASGTCSFDVIVGGKLIREADGFHPRKEVRGLLTTFSPISSDTKLWILLFDLEADPDGTYTLVMIDEFTGNVLFEVFDITIGQEGFRPLDPSILAPHPPPNPLPGAFTVSVSSSIKTPNPTLSIDNMDSFTATLQSGPFGDGSYLWSFSFQAHGWNKTASTLSASQGAGHVGTAPNLTFQDGV
jgi:hypothetical protein